MKKSIIFTVLAISGVYLGPKKVLLAAFNLFRQVRLLWLKLRGSSEQGEIERKVITGKVWQDFCDTLKAAGTALIMPGAPLTPFDQAEGLRALTRILRCGLVNKVELLDHERPSFNTIVDGWAKARISMFSENPDNHYLNAGINSRYAYRIFVKRNTVAYLGFCSQQGKFGGEGGLETVDEKEFEDMGPDEVFTILAAPRNIDNSEHYIALNPEYRLANIVARNNFLNRSEEKAAELSIVKIGEFDYDESSKTLGEYHEVERQKKVGRAEFSERDKLTCSSITEALNDTANMVLGVSMLMAKWIYDKQKTKNEFALVDNSRSKIGADPNVTYFYNYFELKENQCLVITTPIPDCYNWNLQINNHWFESLDYRYFNVTINKSTAIYEADGSISIVISMKKPNVDRKLNWLTTAGHDRGVLTWRWIKYKGNQLITPKCSLMLLSDL